MVKNKKHYCDLLVIGSGIAGLSAAIVAAEQGLDVVVVNKEASPEESNTYYAQGGIVSRGKDDTPQLLIDDIMQAGDGISNLEAVTILATEGPALVEEFLVKRIGVPFSRSEKGELEYAREASHSRRRILYCLDTTGRQIEEGLIKRAREIEHLHFFTDYTAV